MAINIGGTNLISLRMTPDRPGTQVETIVRPGVDGVAFRDLGSRGEPFDALAVVDCDDAAAATAVTETLKALQGHLVDAEDDHGETYTDLMLLQVRILARKAIKSAAGGVSETKGVLMRVGFRLQWSAAES